MSMQDPISDMLTRVRNGQAVGKFEVSMPFSTIKQAIAKVLVDEGYILGYEVEGSEAIKNLIVQLKYFEDRPVIETIKRVSRPGLRIYKNNGDIPSVMNGLGIAIISTSKGVMTDKQARKLNHGGEVLCYVS